MGDWIRALGIDYGTVRIGLAVSDDLGFLAHPLETVSGEKVEAAIERIRDIIEERQIEDMVVGLPLHLDGMEGKAVRRVRRFIEILREGVPENLR
ncbi:MAG: Holliday junction resolvase RuvX, partial [Verrucomicrobiota bacterium]